ncbi:MAG: sigma-70 family RNA polymerase sigma factor [Candidatus Dadabacteria bacterium]|nr:sigma-70 family RNA polymerase sigma factor [Candidatus Dadabacteria bacterium]
METGFLKKLINIIVTKNNEYMSDKSDEELVNLYTKTGDESAFDGIVSRYADKIYGFALRITRNSSDAEEVFQEVFLTLTKKLDTFRGESKFSSWLYRVTVNASYMYLRSQKKYESNISLENYYPYDEKGTLMGRVMEKDWSSRPDIIIFSKEALEIIDKSINELPESYRTVFHLRDIEGLSNEEVADILEISIPAVKSRLHRARLFLRDRLSDYFHEWRR